MGVLLKTTEFLSTKPTGRMEKFANTLLTLGSVLMLLMNSVLEFKMVQVIVNKCVHFRNNL